MKLFSLRCKYKKKKHFHLAETTEFVCVCRFICSTSIRIIYNTVDCNAHMYFYLYYNMNECFSHRSAIDDGPGGE